MKRLLALAAFLFPVVPASQQVPPLDVLLQRLHDYAAHYQAALPSLSCDESILSQRLNKKGKVKWEVKIQSTLREIRSDDPYDPFVEKRAIKSIDGRRSRRAVPIPFLAEGGFANLVGYKSWEQKECFDYTIAPGEAPQTVRLEMSVKPNPPNAGCAKIPAGFDRIVIADPETGRILHSERTISPEVAIKGVDVYFGAIDYAPQKLGDQTFWLPSRFVAHDADNSGRMIATYSNYHRYTGELKMLPGNSIPVGAPQPR